MEYVPISQVHPLRNSQSDFANKTGQILMIAHEIASPLHGMLFVGYNLMYNQVAPSSYIILPKKATLINPPYTGLKKSS
jgi:hypothetical protein